MFAPLARNSIRPDGVIPPRGWFQTLKPMPMTSHVRGTCSDLTDNDITLDHLPCTPYHQLCVWCRISNIHPACQSFRTCIGSDPMVTDRFPVACAEAHPPWDAVVQALMRRLGVESAKLEEAPPTAPETQSLTGKTAPVYVEKYTWTVVVTYNRMHLSPGDVSCMIASHGLRVGEPQSSVV